MEGEEEKKLEKNERPPRRSTKEYSGTDLFRLGGGTGGEGVREGVGERQSEAGDGVREAGVGVVSDVAGLK
jgi:hypothetical protein